MGNIPGFYRPDSKGWKDLADNRYLQESEAVAVDRHGNVRAIYPGEGSGNCTDPKFASVVGHFMRCRRCDNCARYKRHQWFNRCKTEVQTWERSWFITLTFKAVPESPYRDVQLWLKRLRKSVQSPFKYICAQEYGSANQRLHFHLIVCCSATMKRRDVEGPWESGFSKAKLVRPGHVAYVIKYVGKSLERVRASSHWGQGFENVPF